ncbi:MAG: M20/M25/M40 family metallo-hydrolase [Bacteroidetes bacterium]|nr:M20/M25/M40 family metallo-hydrolase [Bacteroidota bacterium]MCL2302012.1 M20/M25/M40 family metallo-hydrolase [Lentimicrobiaceae bacterium]
MTKHLILGYILLISFSLSAQTHTSSIFDPDLKIANQIKTEALKNSKVDEYLYLLCDKAGPKLTGSSGMLRTNTIAMLEMQQSGLENVRIEKARTWERGGWELKKAYMAMTVPYYMHFYPAPVAWTGGTNGLLSGKVHYFSATTHEELEQLKGFYTGKIVLMPDVMQYQINFNPLATIYTEQQLKEMEYQPISTPKKRVGMPTKNVFLTYQDVLDFLRNEKAAVIIHENGDFNVPVITFFSYKMGDEISPCEINVTSEHHGLMQRLIENGEEVKLEIDIDVEFINDENIYYVVGEIMGTDPKLKNELVIIGAHLDGYPMNNGAGDNVTNSVAVLEAMRILKALNIKPKRTIRMILWNGEEVGMHGSKGYVEKYVKDEEGNKLSEYDKISAYYNADYGPGKFRGISTQSNIALEPLFKEWARPWHHIGFTTVIHRNLTSTDHVPFDEAGIPAFQFLQDPLEWGRGSHRVMDFLDRLVPDNIRHNAIILAWFAYKTANLEERLIRKD